MAETDSQSVPFVHLRVHSAFSLLEGALHIKQLADLCRAHRMPALALTDTGNLFGALEYSETLAGAGIQPIIGCTLKVDFGEGETANGKDGFSGGRGNGPRHYPSLVLLAKDEEGYGNLMKLSSRAFLETPDTAPPHVPAALLETHADGLICLTGGPAGPVNDALVGGNGDFARTLMERFKAIFGDRLYVELQRHGTAEENAAEPGLVELAYDLELPLVATNEPYFATPDDFEAHDALICIAESTVIAAEERRRLTPEHYFKAPRDMATLFADIPEAIENTVEVARRCAYRPEPRAPILPSYSTSDGEVMDEADELRRQAREGLDKRLAKDGPADGYEEKDYRERLEYELDIINRMEFPGYFLIVSDFIKKAKELGIPVGPGRGSGAGSLVAYALTITDLDPLRFNLLFERFLNPERVSMPDFDIDFCQERRDEVIEYVQRKYGRDQVAQIITFGKLQARAVCRDVGRVLQMPYGQVDRLCKLIPNNPANPVTLKEAIDGEPRLQEARDGEDDVRMMLEIGQTLEGLYRHASTHAAGVVIGDRPLEELVPLYRDPRSDMPVTQFNMKWVEKAGLVKFDFLGLKTLTVIDKAVELIRRREPGFDLGTIPYSDEKTYEMLSRGDTVGVFQLESSGFKDLLRKARPTHIEDIIALVALYRPGPMDNIPKYLSAKHGEEAPEFLHDKVTPITADTYGVIIYQEQVMQIAQVLSGYSLGEADLLRRAMGKKIKAEMDQQKVRFVDGAVEQGVDKPQAEFIFELVAKFAGYGFNKSHSACYGVIAYQTAYLKANYPVEFLAASMTLDAGNTDKLYVFKREAERLGVTVNPPSINKSDVDFVVEDGEIHYSLAALKNVGRHAIEHIVEERETNGPYASLGDFARRIDPRVMTKRMLENMIRAGAFDAFERNRARLVAGIDAIVNVAGRSAEEARSGQSSLFADSAEADDVPLPATEAWLPMDQLAQEFDAVGFYLSGHPLDDYMEPLKRLEVESWASFSDKVKKKGVPAGRLAGTVTYRQERRSKNGNRFAFVGFSDPTGQFEAIVFSDQLVGTRDLLEPGNAVLLRVEADTDGEEVRLRLHSVEPLEKASRNITSGLTVFIGDDAPLDSLAKRLTNGGRALVRLVVRTGEEREVEISLGNKFTVTPQVKGAIKAIPGVLDVQDL
ncbi:DNA polymerase III subunit alpha [Kaustia mangrovi]|uniref:DNA polymerase III subunit alpha n=1 Tax=Kaustia mangrovi TaxID=2593653 RepID=A0A7S8C156_9HYPH|nr:DNA polymerase III subunit alpha [Kaustia mangrovi]QPC41469.1 DNA polymerase III subunit alpha [Kaustia mangrovi]